MGVVMIRCPETGRGVQTQYAVAPEQFRTMPVFIGRSYCPICRTEHEWFARDAWVDGHSAEPMEFASAHTSLRGRNAVRAKASDPSTREVGDTLAGFLRSQNIARYRRILKAPKDETERQTILTLLTEKIARQDDRKALRDRTLLPTHDIPNEGP